MSELTVGTRGSALALAQTEIFARALQRRHPELVLRVERITTTGDERADVPLTQLGRGVFVTEIEAALRERRIDVAIHSAKDLPSTLASDLTIAAYLTRADARDVLVSRAGGLAELPRGARVGTSSPRRACLLRAARPDLRPVDIRGNVDTRLRKLAAGEFDAIVLAAAGLIRLGRGAEITEWLEPEVMVPSVGQGALAVEARADDATTLGLLRDLDDPATRIAVTAERAFLAELGAGCRAAAAAHARVDGQTVHITAVIGAADGRHVLDSRTAPSIESADVCVELAHHLLRQGGAAFLAGDGRALSGRTIVVTRGPQRAEDLAVVLRAHGADVLVCPTIAIEPVHESAQLDAALQALEDVDWLVFTSASAVGPVAERLHALGLGLPPRIKLAVVGRATARVLGARLREPDFMPDRATADALGSELPIARGDVVLFPRGNIARDALTTRLCARGARVNEVIAYRTVPGEGAGDLATIVQDGAADVIVFASPSSVAFATGFVAAMRGATSPPALVAIGPTTARALLDAGIAPAGEAQTATVGGIVEAVLRAVGDAAAAPQLARR